MEANTIKLTVSLALSNQLTFTDTHTHNTQPFYCSSGICPGPPG